jgi:hypothetical protein
LRNLHVSNMEHLKIKTRLISSKLANVMGEYVIEI